LDAVGEAGGEAGVGEGEGGADEAGQEDGVDGVVAGGGDAVEFLEEETGLFGVSLGMEEAGRNHVSAAQSVSARSAFKMTPTSIASCNRAPCTGGR
jgi:hypothetical protein